MVTVDEWAEIRRLHWVEKLSIKAMMNNSSRTEFDDEEGVDLPEEQVDKREEATGPDDLGVILQEG
jgi:hypothetical protein